MAHIVEEVAAHPLEKEDADASAEPIKREHGSSSFFVAKFGDHRQTQHEGAHGNSHDQDEAKVKLPAEAVVVIFVEFIKVVPSRHEAYQN